MWKVEYHYYYSAFLIADSSRHLLEGAVGTNKNIHVDKPFKTHILDKIKKNTLQLKGSVDVPGLCQKLSFGQKAKTVCT